jgi:hypothetical protein
MVDPKEMESRAVIEKDSPADPEMNSAFGGRVPPSEIVAASGVAQP